MKKKLNLVRETLVALGQDALDDVNGGNQQSHQSQITIPRTRYSCPSLTLPDSISISQQSVSYMPKSVG
jgi:hypothetical protein